MKKFHSFETFHEYSAEIIYGHIMICHKVLPIKYEELVDFEEKIRYSVNLRKKESLCLNCLPPAKT